ncbi:MAG: acyl-ACP thioesterase [Treponema sp.]|nr:acyl-ACP thioesterase [Treponema sp.]
MNIEQEKLQLRFGAVDRSDRLTLASTFDFFQEAAINHAEALGVGREALVKSGQIWVLSRLSVIWERRPLWREEITVRSWPRGWEKLFALRDYDIRDRDGAAVVRGRSCWIILDMEKRRPLRPQPVMESLPLNGGTDAMTGIPASLESREGLYRLGKRTARYSDVDYNGHVNNARYIQWIQDLVDSTLLEQCGQARLDINYLGEVKPGEVVELWAAEFPGEDWDWAAAFEGRRRPENPAAGTGGSGDTAPPAGFLIGAPAPGIPAPDVPGSGVSGSDPGAGRSTPVFRCELRITRG